MVIYKKFDVIIVPFPFTDSLQKKRRPALVISSKEKFNQKNKNTVLAMITSSKNTSWHLDVSISDLNSAGLNADSIVRMKLFTLDNRLIIRKIGILSTQDKNNVDKSLFKLFDDV